MAEVLKRIQELLQVHHAIHWFCNRDDGDLEEKNQHFPKDRKLAEAEASLDYRHKLVVDCLQLFAYDSPDAVPPKELLSQGIERQLSRCDVCIIEYYGLKKKMMEDLRSEYDEDEVEQFGRIFDQRDHARIKRGLSLATIRLKSLPSEEQGRQSLEQPALLAIFEALSCESFLLDLDLLQNHFEEPFKLVQTNSRLQVTHYVPATTIFLFESDPGRCSWAMHAWVKYRVQPTKKDFDFAIREPLTRALALACSPVPDLNFIQRLWCGIRLIVEKLNADLITHSLRAMDVDVCRLALEHLQFDTAGLRFLLQTIGKFLIKAPADFWDAMGAISPTTFIEQIFNNKQYDRYMIEAKNDIQYDYSALKDMLSWIQPFTESLRSSQLPDACRSLTFQLMDRLQSDRFPEYSRIECYHHGLGVLLSTLSKCNKDKVIFDGVGRIVAAETLKLTGTYIKNILSIPGLPQSEERQLALTDPCLRVIKSALALECKSLRTDQEALQHKEQLPHGFSSYTPAIWNTVVRYLDRGNVVLAKAALSGISDLTGLEKFITKVEMKHTKEKSEFNVVLGQLTHLVTQMLERINDFDPDDLDKLFRYPGTAIALVASLFSADSNMYEAGINLIKSISGQVTRKEAISHLLLPFFETTLNSFSWSIRRIAQKRTFGSCPRMLKTCDDVLSILCDTQEGLLRVRALSGIAEVEAVEAFWEHQWEGLKVIYEMTEYWSRRGGDAAMMKDFCRDTMQFSEHFFDQYSIFSSAVDSAKILKREPGLSLEHDEELSARKKLLKNPSQTMEAMVKWLRLRDEYLASTSVDLVTKVLTRLTESRMCLPKAASTFLEQVVTAQTRTMLTAQQKAELARAIELNLGRPVIFGELDSDASDLSQPQSHSGDSSAVVAGSKSNQTMNRRAKHGIIDLEAWSAKGKISQEIIEVEDDELEDSGTPEEDILAVSTSVELFKKQQTAKAFSRKRDNISTIRQLVVKGSGQAQRSDLQKQAAQAAFREKREREIQAKKKRDAEALAKAKRNLCERGIAEHASTENPVLGSLGVLGKDHGLKGSGMMVSSGSETGSEDELDQELFGEPSKSYRLPSAVKDYQASRPEQITAQGPVRKTRQVRSIKDMRARLTPDLSNLHKTILSWNFSHCGEFPPNSTRDNYSLVSNTFRTAADYQRTFEPLLVLEAWQSLLKSKEESSFRSLPIKVVNRMTIDSLIELSTTSDLADGKESGIMEADIVLLSKETIPVSDINQSHCLARVFKITRKKTAMEISYRVTVGNDLVPSMVPKAELHGMKISSITPLEREYGALLGLQYYDLCDEIIKAKASPLLNYTDKQIEPITANYQLNTAQAKAVRSAIDNDAFTLIQGPPGSGKTKTIVAIVGALLTRSLRESTNAIAIRPHQFKGTARTQPNSATLKKLLVCAPSNAAVDELVMRLKQGVKTLDGGFHKLSIVRLGRSDNINTNVLDVTLEELVKAELNLSGPKTRSTSDDIGKIMLDHKTLCEEYIALKTKTEVMRANGESVTPGQDREFEVLRRKKQQLSNKIDILKDSGNTVARDFEINRHRVQQEILNKANVVCATLSGSGHDMFQKLTIEFETVIIDEAAQSIELSALIPLKYGCAKCIMVGDPKQLPPTVLSREAARFQYEQSLFVRMQANRPEDVHLLDTQYRMHPDISAFPSEAFYDGKLVDGPGMAKLRARPWHKSGILGPYRFFDVQGAQRTAPKGHSLINVAELEVALLLFNRLIEDCKGYDFTGKVGIITPYKSQLRELRSRFASRYGESIFSTIDFNTTDAFQGRESEIIIFSCVRASVDKGIGFLSDIRRMNVGITRAKSSLWVLGNSQSLMRGEFWGRLIGDAKRRQCYADSKIIDMLKKPLLSTFAHPREIIPSPPSSTGAIHCPLDADIPDAPTPESLSTGSSISLEVATKTGVPDLEPKADSKQRPLRHDPTISAYRPSGGNGLNVSAMCCWCGSYEHGTSECDNVEARKVGFRCYRCNSLSHSMAFCKAERCTDCGSFGHLAKICTSIKALSKQDGQHIHRLEIEWKNASNRALEHQRKKQTGSHENSVPIVKATTKTPPPELQLFKGAKSMSAMSQKRKRDSPPRYHIPEGSSADARSAVSRSRHTHVQRTKYSTHPPTLSNTASSELASSKPTQRGNGADLAPQQEKGTIEKYNPRSISSTSMGSVNGEQNFSLTSKDYDPVNNIVAQAPIARRKREVDPFIRPKQRRKQ